MPGGVGVVAGADAPGAQLPGQQPPPGLVREQRGVGDPSAEVELGGPLEQRSWARSSQTGLGRSTAPVGVRLRRSAGGGASETKVPAPTRPVRNPSREEPVVGDRDGGAGDAQLRGQLAGGRQAIAGGQATVQDRPAQLPVDLAGQVLAADQADMEVHGAQGSGGPIGLVNLARNWISQRSLSAPRLAKAPHAQYHPWSTRHPPAPPPGDVHAGSGPERGPHDNGPGLLDLRAGSGSMSL